MWTQEAFPPQPRSTKGLSVGRDLFSSRSRHSKPLHREPLKVLLSSRALLAGTSRRNSPTGKPRNRCSLNSLVRHSLPQRTSWQTWSVVSTALARLSRRSTSS
ncbi:unnamed protein product [Pleuronectes platessa]|uniref:Uncharacterized protein n=1 Tax=Pleuronectes platessa TaxID=8262 RepID=A0A9N7UKT8_PLEPL|nr:unnamed protein product [Pleuronectes platessa]